MARKQIDYSRMEEPWRAGILSVLQIAANYEQETGVAVSHTAVNRYFKNNGIPRDLAAKIKAKADAIVSASEVSGEVSTVTVETERKIVDANAMTVAAVQLSHRSDIKRSRGLVSKLQDELEHQTSNQPEYEKLGELLASPDGKGVDKVGEIYRKAMSLPSRVDTMKKLADTHKTLIGLEREAFNIKSADGGADEKFTEIVRRIVG